MIVPDESHIIIKRALNQHDPVAGGTSLPRVESFVL